MPVSPTLSMIHVFLSCAYVKAIGGLTDSRCHAHAPLDRPPRSLALSHTLYVYVKMRVPPFHFQVETDRWADVEAFASQLLGGQSWQDHHNLQLVLKPVRSAGGRTAVSLDNVCKNM
jgi:hypothetical protein